MIDDEDYELVNQYKWRVAEKGHLTYAKAWTREPATIRKIILMHRLVMNILGTDLQVDHKNGNGLDNQKENLRIATQSVNAQNSRPRGKSKFRGVYFNERQKKWKVTCKKLYIGYFNTEEEAAIAYNKAALEIYGPEATLNILENYDT